MMCVQSSSWKIFFWTIRASWWLSDSFRPPEAKNVWFLLSRHDVRRVNEKFSSRRFEQSDGCYSHFGLLSPKTFDSYFLDMMYAEFMKNFLLANSSEMMAVRLMSASWAQKRLIPTFLKWCTSSAWKIFFSPISSELLAVRFILASWAQKLLIPTFLTWYPSSSRKIFLSPIWTSRWLLD